MVSITKPQTRRIALSLTNSGDTAFVHILSFIKGWDTQLVYNNGYEVVAYVRDEVVDLYLSELLRALNEALAASRLPDAIAAWCCQAVEQVVAAQADWRQKANYCDLKVQYEGKHDVLACPLMRTSTIMRPDVDNGTEYAFIALNQKAEDFLYDWSMKQSDSKIIRSVFGLTVYADEKTLKGIMKEAGIRYYDGFL